MVGDMSHPQPRRRCPGRWGTAGARGLCREMQQAADPEAIFTQERPRTLSKAGHTALQAMHTPKTPGVLGFGVWSPQNRDLPPGLDQTPEQPPSLRRGAGNTAPKHPRTPRLPPAPPQGTRARGGGDPGPQPLQKRGRGPQQKLPKRPPTTCPPRPRAYTSLSCSLSPQAVVEITAVAGIALHLQRTPAVWGRTGDLQAERQPGTHTCPPSPSPSHGTLPPSRAAAPPECIS